MELSDYVLLETFSHVTERELCRLAQTCQRFNTIANDSRLWKSLYREKFEYDLPIMLGPSPGDVYFVETREQDVCLSSASTDPVGGSLENTTDAFPGMRITPWVPELLDPQDSPSICEDQSADPSASANHDTSAPGRARFIPNTWKESFRQLSRALHVLPSCTREAKRNCGITKYFDEIEGALECCEKLLSKVDHVPLILIHSGIHYLNRDVEIRSSIRMLGCGPGRNPAETVQIEQDDVHIHPGDWRDATTFCFLGTNDACPYLGYLTMIVVANLRLGPYERDCIELGQGELIVDHCRIQSKTSEGAGISTYEEANTRLLTVRYCDISYSGFEGVGIELFGDVQCLIEHNRISRCDVGIKLYKNASLILRRNKILECKIGVGKYDDRFRLLQSWSNDEKFPNACTRN